MLFITFIAVISLYLVFNLSHDSRNHDRFIDVAQNVGINYQSKLKKQDKPISDKFMDNDGVYVGDFNGDRLPDVFLTGGTVPKLYENHEGNFQSVESFPELPGDVIYGLFVDYDRDGEVDLVAIRKNGPIRILENNSGSFRMDEKIKELELSSAVGATSGDFDQDGCPDIFLIQYGGPESLPLQERRFRLGAQYRNLDEDNGARNYLIPGNCSGFEQPLKNPEFDRQHWSLATSYFDANGDSYPDLHVANDFFRDSLYLNNGDGTFTHRYMEIESDRNGMSSEIADFLQNGRHDIFVSNIFLDPENPVFRQDYLRSVVTRNPDGHNAFVNRGGEFEDFAVELGLQKGGWGWAASWRDFDLDGKREIIQARQNYIAVSSHTGLFVLENNPVKKFIRNYQRFRKIPMDEKSNNDHYKWFQKWMGYPGTWDRKENGFEALHEKEWGFPRMNARGVAALDSNRSGSLDLFVTEYNRPFKLFRNPHKPKSQPVRIKVEPRSSIGTLRYRVNGKSRYVPVTSGTDFLSQESPFYHISPPDKSSLEFLEMKWIDGKVQRMENIQLGRNIIFSKESS